MILTREDIINRVLKTLTFCLLALHLITPVLNHYYFRTHGYDYAVYNFAFFDYAHFSFTPCPIYHQPYPVKFIQDHFSLALFFLSPLYWVLDPLIGSYSLILLQFFAIAASARATYLIAKQLWDTPYMSYLFSLIFLYSYQRFSAYENDVNLVILGSALLPVWVYLILKRKFYQSFFVFVFLITCREDFCMTLLFLSLMFMLVKSWASYRRIFLFYFLLSFVAIPLIFGLVLPALEDNFKKYSVFNYSLFGDNPKEAVQHALTHPFKTLQLLVCDNNYKFSGLKFAYYLQLLGGGGVYSFFTPSLSNPAGPLSFKKNAQ